MVACRLELDSCRLFPLSLAPPLKILAAPRRPASLRLAAAVPRRFRAWRLTVRYSQTVAGAKPDDQGDRPETLEGVEKVGISVGRAEAVVMDRRQWSQLRKRIVFGLGIGIGTGGIVVAGGWVFTAAVAAVVFAGAREYFELVRSRGIADGMTPPPRYVSRVCAVICTLMPVLTLYFGHMDVSVTSFAFVLAMSLILQRGIPRFAQLTSAMFGLFYCGYLPSFWVKLRCCLGVPALHTKLGHIWPVLLGGQAHWTVGLVATLISISSIIAADTCAFLGGRLLHALSPHRLRGVDLFPFPCTSRSEAGIDPGIFCS